MPQTDAIVDVVPSPIARSRQPALGLVAAGSALRADRALTVERLRRLSESLPSSRGRRRARWVWDRATRVPESPLEYASLAVIEWLGFPRPSLQQRVLGPSAGDDDRVDFWWEGWGVAGEADGEVKYSGAFGDAREALRARNARDARLRDRGVGSVAHWAWADVVAPLHLRAILAATGLPVVRPRDLAALESFARALGTGHAAPLAPTRPR